MKKSFWILTTCFFAFVCGIMIGYVNVDKRTTEATEQTVRAKQVDIETEKPKELEGSYIKDEIVSYKLIEKDGQITIYSVYENGSEELLERTDISTSSMRAEDRKALKNGIETKTKEEALMLLEDFES